MGSEDAAARVLEAIKRLRAEHPGHRGCDTAVVLAALAVAEAERAEHCYRLCGHVYPHEPVSQAQIAEGKCPTCEVREQLAAAEAERDHLTHELADERRKMHVYAPDDQVTHCGCRLCGERQVHATRLAALAAAARAWHATRGVSNPTTRREAERVLEDAVAALVAPPEDGA